MPRAETHSIRPITIMGVAVFVFLWLSSVR